MASIRDTFQRTARASHDVLAAPEIAAHWYEPSVLAEFSIRGLAGHLARATTSVEAYLDREQPMHVPITAAAYYAAVVDIPDINSDLHKAIRQRGEDFAAEGHAVLIEKHAATLGRLEKRLQEEPPDRKVEVYKGLVLELDDYLITRVIELTVHIDDLVASAGVALPEIDPEAYQLAIENLVGVARFRHGDLAVLRALTRRERDPVEALRVL